MLTFTHSENSHIVEVHQGKTYIGCVYRYDDPSFGDHFESYDVPYGLTETELRQLADFVGRKDG